MIGVFGDATQAEVAKHLKSSSLLVAQGERKRTGGCVAPKCAFTWLINPT